MKVYVLGVADDFIGNRPISRIGIFSSKEKAMGIVKQRLLSVAITPSYLRYQMVQLKEKGKTQGMACNYIIEEVEIDAVKR